MFRVLSGLILIGVGIYFAWEAHSVLNDVWFQVAVMISPDAEITPMEVQALNSPAADLMAKVGADTVAELERYLSILRIVAIVVGIAGVLLLVIRPRPARRKWKGHH